MPHSSPVTAFLRQVAEQNKHAIFSDISGSIDVANGTFTQSSGSVYGIWAKSEVALKPGLLAIPRNADWYPVYWGKDISPVSRLKAHVKGHRNNGNINLPAITALKGIQLIFGAILVERYRAFEVLLHSKYQPMLGTPASGRTSSVIKVAG